MKRVVALLVAVLLLGGVIFASCGQTLASMSNTAPANTAVSTEEAAPKAEYRKIDAADAKEMMESNPDAIILDVRTQQEFDEKHIDGAVLIPDTELKDRAAAELPDKEAVILIYCRSGNRSRSAANALLEMGYSNVYDFGGINDWPYETVS